MSGNRLALRRINKDIREITNNPIEGIGLISINNNPFEYIVNLKLMCGPYQGYCLQLSLTFNDQYPTRPPKILILPGQAINNSYHHHIFDDTENHGYKKFCFDLLDNEFLNTNEEHTGWNPSYSISFLLLQVQNFISDPELKPSKNMINQLMNSMNNYSSYFKIIDEDGNIQEIIHTWKNPYPQMYFKENEKKDDKNEDKEKEDQKKKEEEEEKKKEEEHKLEIIKENLNCFMLKVNYIDDPDIFLGYPLVYTKGKYGNKIELFPIPELLSYEGFSTQVNIQFQAHFANLFFYSQDRLKSANNEYFNNWLPIYINKEHYEKNKNTIFFCFNNILINNNNNLNNNYSPELIFKVLPMILNSMIIGLFNGRRNCSSSFIRCYFQYILLFKKLCQEYETEYLDYLNTKFNIIKNNNYIVNKKIIPDIGDFFMLLIFCNLDTKGEKMKKIYHSLYEDSLVRQMFWMFHSEETKTNMKTKLLSNIISNDSKYFKKFKEDKNFKMKTLDKFNEDLHTKGIFEQVVDIIINDEVFLEHIFLGKKKVKSIVEKRMKESFKRIFNECSEDGQKKLEDLIKKNLTFSHYFKDDNFEESELYDEFKVDKILEKKTFENIDEILKYAFENQKGNKLYIISSFAQKKIEEPGFMEELEKNYGVYIDVDNFIKDMKQKLEEIKTYKDFYKYVGTDYGNEKTEKELIIEAYKKAKEKGYIKTVITSENIRKSPIKNRELGSNLTNSRNSRISRHFINNSLHSQNRRTARRRSRSRSRSRSDHYSLDRSSRNRRSSHISRYSRSRSRSHSRDRRRRNYHERREDNRYINYRNNNRYRPY